jgi:predicted RNA binding protein YcfA (HicA-like mRNA interferase family)
LKKLRPIEGKELIRILCNDFGFRAIRQKGSHVTLTNGTIYVTVPAKEIRVGLLNVILKDCGITREKFLRSL